MAEILIYDFIGEDFTGAGVTLKGVKSELDAIPADEQITVRINSGGGDVFDGVGIHNLLSERGVDVVIDGLAASAASVIAMAGNTVSMAPGAMMMIHDPWTFAIGNATDMRKTAETLDKIRDSLVTTYHNKTGIDRAEIEAAMAAETWMTAQEAEELGYAVRTTTSADVVMNANYRWIRNAPKSLAENAKGQDREHEFFSEKTVEIKQPEFRIAARQRLQKIR